jgi:hypothetical protein
MIDWCGTGRVSSERASPTGRTGSEPSWRHPGGAQRWLLLQRRARLTAPLILLLAVPTGAGCSEGTADPIAAGGRAQVGIAGSGGASSATGASSARAGSAGAGALSGSAGGGAISTPLRTFDFAVDVEGWALGYADPARLVAPAIATGDAGVDAALVPPPAPGTATAAHDASVGDPDPGSVLLNLPFDAPNQKIDFEVNVANNGLGVSLAGRGISLRLRVDSGLALNPMNPAGVKLYVKTGPLSVYADSGFLNILPGSDWQTFTWPNVSTPAYTDPAGPHAPDDVRQLGFELATGDVPGTYSAAIVHVDTVVY